MGKYIIIIEAAKAPQIFIDDLIPNVGKVIELKAETLPNRVDVAWLMTRYPFSRKIILEKLRDYNKGTDSKHLYDPQDVMPVLNELNAVSTKRGAGRKN